MRIVNYLFAALLIVTLTACQGNDIDPVVVDVPEVVDAPSVDEVEAPFVVDDFPEEEDLDIEFSEEDYVLE